MIQDKNIDIQSDSDWWETRKGRVVSTGVFAHLSASTVHCTHPESKKEEY